MISVLTSSSDTLVCPPKVTGHPLSGATYIGHIHKELHVNRLTQFMQAVVIWRLQFTAETESAVLHYFHGSPGSDGRYVAITTSSQSTPAQKC